LRTSVPISPPPTLARPVLAHFLCIGHRPHPILRGRPTVRPGDLARMRTSSSGRRPVTQPPAESGEPAEAERAWVYSYAKMRGTCREMSRLGPVPSPLRRDRTGREPIGLPSCPVRQPLGFAWLYWHAHLAYASANQMSVRPVGSTRTPIRLRACARSTQR
jgi:hypothetical protein